MHIIIVLLLMFFAIVSMLVIFKLHCNKKEKLFHEFMHVEEEEIKIYKWIRSEEAHHDLGNKACIEWIEKYAKDYRKKWNKDHKFLSKFRSK